MRRTDTQALVETSHAFFAAWKTWLRSRLPPGETNPKRVLVLVSLERWGPVTMGTLSARLAIPKPNLTALVDALELEGLLVRQQHPEDRRALLLRLTPEGRRSARKRSRGYDAEVGKLFEVLDAPAQRALLQALQTLVGAVKK